MKILELTNFSAGACGVWMRAKQEAELLAKKGHTVKVFSSNFTKGSKEIAPQKEKLGKIDIIRFPARKLGGESFMIWDFEKEALNFHPDLIIAHSYRHPHTTTALKIKNRIGCKVFLVTHAPFLSDSNRLLPSKLAVNVYDKIIGPRKLKKFDKILTITKWENKILEQMHVPREKIAYIPNGIPKEFFTQKKSKEEKKVLFLGRVAPIKDLETLIQAINLLKDVKLEIAGPAEKDYLKKLKSLNPNSNIKFSPPVYETKEKIKKIDSAKIFVLPSIRESMPQSLIEAMAREKIVIASDNLGAKELISDGKNGFLFKIGDEKQLAEKISLALKQDFKDVRKQARKSVEQFSWDKIIQKIEKLIAG
ncbi:MAG: glycosyltransferase family 4 protein [Nanoarchaeota archaeon]|nr:glycosyltransferase family 4 protein [Nanoarchaeota archaeon]